MARRGLGLRFATALGAGLLAIAGGYAGAQTAPATFPAGAAEAAAAIPSATAAASLAVSSPTARPATPRPTDGPAVTTATSGQPGTARGPAAPGAASVSIGQEPPSTPSAAAVAPGAKPASPPTRALPPAPPAMLTSEPPSTAPAGGIASPTPPAAAPPSETAVVAPASQHSIRGIVVQEQGDVLLLHPLAGSNVRVIIGPGTVIRGGAAGRLPRSGDRAVVVGAPRPDGALAARAMLLAPGSPSLGPYPGPRRRG